MDEGLEIKTIYKGFALFVMGLCTQWLIYNAPPERNVSFLVTIMKTVYIGAAIFITSGYIKFRTI